MVDVTVVSWYYSWTSSMTGENRMTAWVYVWRNSVRSTHLGPWIHPLFTVNSRIRVQQSSNILVLNCQYTKVKQMKLRDILDVILRKDIEYIAEVDIWNKMYPYRQLRVGKNRGMCNFPIPRTDLWNFCVRQVLRHSVSNERCYSFCCWKCY